MDHYLWAMLKKGSIVDLDENVSYVSLGQVYTLGQLWKLERRSACPIITFVYLALFLWWEVAW